MKEIAKLGAILLVISAICAGLVGYASEITKEPIAKQESETKAKAMQEVLPDAEGFEEREINDEIAEAYAGMKNGEVVGYVAKVTPKGYGGTMELMVGIANDGVIKGIKLLSHSETPGLGANAKEASFTDQFKEKMGELEVVKGNASGDDEISAITGATITTKAVANAVNAVTRYVQSQGGGAQ